jgi:hypothetical protein
MFTDDLICKRIYFFVHSQIPRVHLRHQMNVHLESRTAQYDRAVQQGETL